MRLSYDFYNHHVTEVAKNLLGKKLIFRGEQGIVAEEAGQAGAVLIRALKLPHVHLNGPGKICRHFGITKEYNGVNLVDSDHFYLTEGAAVKNISITPRIGISKAVDKPWRFVAGAGHNTKSTK